MKLNQMAESLMILIIVLQSSYWKLSSDKGDTTCMYVLFSFSKIVE